MNSSKWLSLHVFYNSDPHWLLVEAVSKVAARLLEGGRASKYFFIRYWEQGFHIRLRFEIRAQDERAIAREVCDVVEAFIRARPSIFSFPGLYMPPAYSHLYIKEYGEAALAAKYGPTGRIPYQPNNTIVETRYEPEYARYGGVRGVAIAEQHFHASSTLALNVMGSANGHDFRVILGHSLSFFLLTCFALLPPEAWVHFCEHYEARWSRSNPNINDVSRKAFQAKYARQRSQIRKKVAQCWAAHQCGAASGLLDQTRKTLDSLSRDLRSALPEIRGQLATPEPASDLDHVFFLMTSYIHMHNNRLGLFNLDEVYVAYVSKHALREFWPSTAAANGAPSPLATLAA